MKVWVVYKDYGVQGNTEPLAVFDSQMLMDEYIRKIRKGTTGMPDYVELTINDEE